MTTIDDVTIIGDGTQNVFGNTVSRDLILNQLKFVRGRPSMVLSEGEIVDRVAGYVPALNHGEIVETLRRCHAVALAGPAGDGVATTAIAALRQLRPDMPVRLFSTGEDDVEEIGTAEARGYLVRAGDEEESRLRSCFDAVRASGGYLLVVGTAAEQWRFADFLPAITARPPAADAVYRRRLIRCGLGSTRWPDWPRAVDLLKDASPGDARRLADLVVAVSRKGGAEQEAELAYRGWAEQLRDWFTDHPNLRDQALMLAAATIAPADETSVYGAALSLAQRLKITVEGGGLVWCPSTGLDELLGADRDGDRIMFRRQGFAASVLRHVWDDYPLARLDLLSWLSMLPTDEVVTLEPELRNKLVEVFADLAAEHDSVEKILQMAERWASDQRQDADLAYVALARTCLHPLVGGRVRRKLYEWSREQRAAQTLKLTVARVCEVLGQTHTTIALTRLKHLATYGDEQVQEEVFAVARALAEPHPEVVFTAALAWCQDAPRLSGRDGARRTRVGLRLLLHLLPGRGPMDSPPDTGVDRPGLSSVVRTIEHLAIRGDAHIRSVTLEAARELSVDHRAVVLRTALDWAGNTGGRRYEEALPRATFGTGMFLALAAERDTAGLPVTLTGPSAIEPMACAPAWRLALSAESTPGGGYVGFGELVWLWLDTAVARPDLRRGIASAFVSAAGGDPVLGQVMVGFARSWAGVRPERQGVKYDIYIRLLKPEWQRLLLMLLVKVRTMLAG
ncbi:MAG: hypothetical protein ACRDOO_09720 [Actinomadura sp.]